LAAPPSSTTSPTCGRQPNDLPGGPSTHSTSTIWRRSPSRTERWSMAEYSKLTPVNIITGFLGSGKTTLLQRLLRSPDLADVAVLVNEFGEVGLDHHLLQGVAENTVLLGNGCLCCAVRGDLQRALRDLLSRRTRGDVPNFRRVVIETSGLADLAPIAYTLLSEAVLRHHFRLSGIITTVDAVNGADQLD